MLHFRRFCEEVLAPEPARESYVQRGSGRGWPEQCPPVRGACAFGFDVRASVDVELARGADGRWVVEAGGSLTADWAYAAADEDDEGEAAAPPQVQEAAWGWDENQVLPHVISPEVAPLLRDQFKLSTFLYLATDPNELLLFTDVPHGPRRPFRVLSALVETDWYPASYPWHCVIELDAAAQRVTVARGEPLCRIVPVRREAYLAREMDDAAFGAFFDRGQAWLARHGKGDPGEMMDITGAYARQQLKPAFRVVL